MSAPGVILGDGYRAERKLKLKKKISTYRRKILEGRVRRAEILRKHLDKNEPNRDLESRIWQIMEDAEVERKLKQMKSLLGSKAFQKEAKKR